MWPPATIPSGFPGGSPFSTSLTTPSPPKTKTASPCASRASSVAWPVPLGEQRLDGVEPLARARAPAASVTRLANGLTISVGAHAPARLRRRRVPAHAVDEQREEAVGELVGVAARLSATCTPSSPPRGRAAPPRSRRDRSGGRRGHAPRGGARGSAPRSGAARRRTPRAGRPRGSATPGRTRWRRRAARRRRAGGRAARAGSSRPAAASSGIPSSAAWKAAAPSRSVS